MPPKNTPPQKGHRKRAHGKRVHGKKATNTKSASAAGKESKEIGAGSYKDKPATGTVTGDLTQITALLNRDIKSLATQLETHYQDRDRASDKRLKAPHILKINEKTRKLNQHVKSLREHIAAYKKRYGNEKGEAYSFKQIIDRIEKLLDEEYAPKPELGDASITPENLKLFRNALEDIDGYITLAQTEAEHFSTVEGVYPSPESQPITTYPVPPSAGLGVEMPVHGVSAPVHYPEKPGETRNLVVLHRGKGEGSNIGDVNKLGGLPVPSVLSTRVDSEIADAAKGRIGGMGEGPSAPQGIFTVVPEGVTPDTASRMLDEAFTVRTSESPDHVPLLTDPRNLPQQVQALHWVAMGLFKRYTQPSDTPIVLDGLTAEIRSALENAGQLKELVTDPNLVAMVEGDTALLQGLERLLEGNTGKINSAFLSCVKMFGEAVQMYVRKITPESEVAIGEYPHPVGVDPTLHELQRTAQALQDSLQTLVRGGAYPAIAPVRRDTGDDTTRGDSTIEMATTPKGLEGPEGARLISSVVQGMLPTLVLPSSQWGIGTATIYPRRDSDPSPSLPLPMKPLTIHPSGKDPAGLSTLHDPKGGKGGPTRFPPPPPSLLHGDTLTKGSRPNKDPSGVFTSHDPKAGTGVPTPPPSSPLLRRTDAGDPRGTSHPSGVYTPSNPTGGRGGPTPTPSLPLHTSSIDEMGNARIVYPHRDMDRRGLPSSPKFFHPTLPPGMETPPSVRHSFAYGDGSARILSENINLRSPKARQAIGRLHEISSPSPAWNYNKDDRLDHDRITEPHPRGETRIQTIDIFRNHVKTDQACTEVTGEAMGKIFAAGVGAYSEKIRSEAMVLLYGEPAVVQKMAEPLWDMRMRVGLITDMNTLAYVEYLPHNTSHVLG